MTDVTIGYGTTVRAGRGSPTPTFTTLDKVGDVQFPQDSVDKIETTHQSSPGRRKEYVAGLIDSGDVTIPVSWIPGSATDVLATAILASGERVLLEFTAANGGEAETWAAFCSGYSRTAPVNDKMAAEIMFALSGRVDD